MTQQYIVGELSSLVAALEPTAGELGRALRRLRREIEVCPLDGLPTLAREVPHLPERLFWAAHEEGDLQTFGRCADTARALREFTASANLLP